MPSGVVVINSATAADTAADTAAVADATAVATTNTSPAANGANATASDSEDDDSLSSEAPRQASAQGNGDEADNVVGDASDSPGQVQLLLRDSSRVNPKDVIRMKIFFAKCIGKDVDNDLAEVVKKSSRKQLLTVSKSMLCSEINRRDPSIKLTNTKNITIKRLWERLPALDDVRDIDYISTQYESIRTHLLESIRSEDSEEASVAQRKSTDVLRAFLLIVKYEELRRAYALSQTSSTREMLDAGETYLSRFLKLWVTYFNDPSKTVSTSPQQSLHYTFGAPIICDKGAFEFNEEKAKKLLGDCRRHLTTMINNWEKSGNGSNQQRLDDDDEDSEFDMDLWGRFDADKAMEHEDGDDRANFLKHLPFYWLMVWHICDEGDLLRFTCAQLRDEHSASSDSTPLPVSRGGGTSSARKLLQQTYELQQDIAVSVKNIGNAVSALAADDSFERASKIRRLDQLKGERYNVFKDTKCRHITEEERVVATDYVNELDERIATIESELQTPS
eukprot:CAMPEP_0201733090 /NCGR_PEP_ID=MMETSP0593-20130828/30630_1 /ASSEMBLY_ACC=CAM_ASM_000672 /TAXON_ID=267983 /ORGANISM="Skeletonema japonicum, Strain CCMP2506" /LENGTH=504 /DNA_ID=CAMNT_0048226179 /DNA_START=116 /DNA_END=1627 /DNA_ORIENTATION=-